MILANLKFEVKNLAKDETICVVGGKNPDVCGLRMEIETEYFQAMGNSHRRYNYIDKLKMWAGE